MKKVFAFVILTIFVFSPLFDALGQKTRKTLQLPKLTETSSEIRRAEAFSDGNGAWLRFQTENDKNVIGFNIYRITENSSVRINPNMIPGGYFRAERTGQTGGEFTYFDEKGGLQSSYFIERIDINGQSTKFAPFNTQPIGDLAYVAGVSSESLKKSRAEAQPVIEKSTPILPKGISVSESNFNFPNQKWVATQAGVKIGVKEEGIYRVMRAELAAAGFDVNSSPNLWQLYMNGNEQAINVHPAGDYIEFYGRNPVDTVDSGTQIYFLLVGATDGKRIAPRIIRMLNSTVRFGYFYENQYKEERLTYFSSFLNGDTENFYGTFIGSTPANVTFNLKGIDQSVAKTPLTVSVFGATLTPHTVRVVVNGQELGTMSGANRTKISQEFSILTSFLQEGENTLQLTSLAGASDFSVFDSISVNLARKYTADNNQLSFYTQHYRASDIENFTTNDIRVFDLTYPDAPTLLSNLQINDTGGGSFSVTIPSNRGRRMYAATAAALKQPVSITANTPSSLSTPSHNGKMIIISHKNWMTEANLWADYRENEGMSVEVVDIDDIYDEFSYGVRSSMAIRSFLHYAKINWQIPPDYVLLMGDATFDPRNYLGLGDFTFVPTKLVDTTYTETGSDDALADFNNDGLAEIPIGRLPVRSGAEITHILNKVMTFEQSVANAIDRGTVCASDRNEGYDFIALCNRVMNELPQNVAKTFINRDDPNSATVLQNTLNEGKYLVNYVGHGAPTIWATSGFFSASSAMAMTNGDNLSVFTMLTCLNGYFIDPTIVSLSESLLKAPNGGGVAAWSSSGLTTPEFQEIMAKRFYRQIGIGKITRLGDLIKDSKTVIAAGRDVRLSWVLLGDPTLKVR